MRPWSAAEAEKELKRRLTNAKRYRERFEAAWENNERSLYNVSGIDSPNVKYSFESELDLSLGEVDSGNDSVGINYLFKNFRFIHAQLSANPPTVLARPTSTDTDDRRKADAADRLIRHAIRAEKMQEKVDQASAKTLLYGTGWMKTLHNPNAGDIVGRDDETGEFELEGKIEVYTPSTWDVWIDPNADSWENVRFVFERKRIALEEALMLWPDKEEELREAAKNINLASTETKDNTEIDEQIIEVYEYWENGLPVNAMLGRHAICLESGCVLQDPKPSPFKFSPSAESEEDGEMPPTAYLPYHPFTDIDIVDEVYGKSFVEYEAPIQELINRLDSATLDNVQAHGVTRMVLPEGTELADDAITNSPWDIVQIKGTQPPHYVSPPSVMPESSQLRDRLKLGGDDVAGVNDAMFGKMERETSGFSLQYATNQGNMIRRRLFNKYVLFIESIYKGYLSLVRKHWDVPRIIHVLGAEKAFEAMDIKGADISGGFDLVVEYGASLSLDPTTRREEILQLMPLFEKAGVDNKTLLSMLKLNELESLYDIMELAKERQREVFEEMIAGNKYIEPKELEEHKGMLDYAYRYIMSAEFKNLTDDQKALIEQHIKARELLAVQGAGVQMPQGPAPGPAPAGPQEVPMAAGGAAGPTIPGPQGGTPAG